MKIPFTKYHIVKEQVLIDKKEAETRAEAARVLMAGEIPNLKQLNIALHEAKVGHASHGRRIARRKLEREAAKLKTALTEAA